MARFPSFTETIVASVPLPAHVQAALVLDPTLREQVLAREDLAADAIDAVLAQRRLPPAPVLAPAVSRPLTDAQLDRLLVHHRERRETVLGPLCGFNILRERHLRAVWQRPLTDMAVSALLHAADGPAAGRWLLPRLAAGNPSTVELLDALTDEQLDEVTDAVTDVDDLRVYDTRVDPYEPLRLLQVAAGRPAVARLLGTLAGAGSTTHRRVVATVAAAFGADRLGDPGHEGPWYCPDPATLPSLPLLALAALSPQQPAATREAAWAQLLAHYVPNNPLRQLARPLPDWNLDADPALLTDPALASVPSIRPAVLLTVLQARGVLDRADTQTRAKLARLLRNSDDLAVFPALAATQSQPVQPNGPTPTLGQLAASSRWRRHDEHVAWYLRHLAQVAGTDTATWHRILAMLADPSAADLTADEVLGAAGAALAS